MKACNTSGSRCCDSATGVVAAFRGALVGHVGHLSGLIFAAGQGRRLGAGPKVLLRYRYEYFLERLARIFHESGGSPIIAVLGCGADEVLESAHLGNASAVLNYGSRA